MSVRSYWGQIWRIWDLTHLDEHCGKEGSSTRQNTCEYHAGAPFGIVSDQPSILLAKSQGRSQHVVHFRDDLAPSLWRHKLAPQTRSVPRNGCQYVLRQKTSEYLLATMVGAVVRPEPRTRAFAWAVLPSQRVSSALHPSQPPLYHDGVPVWEWQYVCGRARVGGASPSRGALVPARFCGCLGALFCCAWGVCGHVFWQL